MSHVIHEIIAVTSYDQRYIHMAHSRARDLFPTKGGVSAIYHSATNAYYTFVIMPDGSKEGWPEAEEAEKKRVIFIEWLKTQAFEDGSSPYAWHLGKYDG